MKNNIKKKQNVQKEVTGPYGMCPFVIEPIEACYCFVIDSNEKIESSIHYCQHNFKECEIYQRRVKQTGKTYKNDDQTKGVSNECKNWD